MEKEFPCPKCERKLKSASGLIGHMRLMHSEQKVRTTPDDIGQRLENIEAVVASTINPGEVKSEAEIVKALKLLLPAMERFDLAVGNFNKNETPGGFLATYVKKYRIVKNKDLSTVGMLGGPDLSVESEVKDLL